MQSLFRDFNVEVGIDIKSDATAAIGMARRQGLGRVRHLATSDLWIQQRLRAGDFSVQKHPGATNSTDLMTKVKPRTDILKFLGPMGFMVGQGRPSISPIRSTWTVDHPSPAPGGGCEVDAQMVLIINRNWLWWLASPLPDQLILMIYVNLCNFLNSPCI